MNSYEAKQEAKRERLEARADRLKSEAASAYKRANEMASIIPFGQPILVGHHSEGADRNYRKRISATYERSFEASKAAGEAQARANSVGTGGISSDDPDAVAKLTTELVEHEARQEQMKAANKAWSKAGNKMGRQPDGTWIDPPNPAFRLSNNSANMTRIRERIEQLKRAATRENKSREIEGGIKIVENADDNRLQIFFPGKPSEEIRTKLKAHGFRWAPSEGAWQRQLSTNAIWDANFALGITT